MRISSFLLTLSVLATWTQPLCAAPPVPPAPGRAVDATSPQAGGTAAEQVGSSHASDSEETGDNPATANSQSEETEPSDTTSPPKGPVIQNPSESDDQPPESQRQDNFNEELLKKLLRGNAGESGTNDEASGSGRPAAGSDPLGKAIRSMRDAQQRISTHDTGAETQELQRRAVDELTKLIEMAENSPPQQNPPSPGQQPPGKSGQQPPSQADGQQPATGTQTQRPAGTGQAEATQSEKAKESSERPGQHERRDVELLRRRALLQQVWGHLPPGVRQKLLNVTSEKPLPEYEDLVRRYYEALAEPKRSVEPE